jgi:hypothetical protein
VDFASVQRRVFWLFPVEKSSPLPGAQFIRSPASAGLWKTSPATLLP